MKVTLFGAAVSDGFEDGRVVSGVGGQYNFVAMAHELKGARSILLTRATREAGGRIESNVVFNYGHATIPRHLRDIVVTEYGIAAEHHRRRASVARRARNPRQALARLAHLRDALENTPERLAARLEPLARQELLPMFPLGTDFDATEQRLVAALQWLKGNAAGWRGRITLAAGLARAFPAAEDSGAFARMGLDAPRGPREWLLRRLVALALDRTR